MTSKELQVAYILMAVTLTEVGGRSNTSAPYAIMPGMLRAGARFEV